MQARNTGEMHPLIKGIKRVLRVGERAPLEEGVHLHCTDMFARMRLLPLLSGNTRVCGMTSV